MSTAAYCGLPHSSRQALEEWRCGLACDKVHGVSHVRQIIGDRAGTDATAFMGRLRGECIVSFRGTANFGGWMQDLRSGVHMHPSKHGINCSHGSQKCRVGAGWLETYLQIRQYLKGNLTAIGCGPRNKLTFAGHSLGAAVAQLAMFDLRGDGYEFGTSYFFGSPRVGDLVWGQAFEDRVGNQSGYRITYHRDPVPHQPAIELGYAHTLSEVFYDGNVSMGYRICQGLGEHEECAGRYHDALGMVAGCLRHLENCDHLQYMTALKELPMDGASCTGRGAELPLVV
jgi:hypothetical protein